MGNLYTGERKVLGVKGASVKSKLFSPSDIQSIMKKAMVKRLSEHYHREWFSEDGAHIRCGCF